MLKIPARCDYACKTILELSMNWPKKEPVQIEYIARKQGIPIKFLVHILLQLKRLGIIESTRGKKGGYILIEPPSKITLGMVIKGTGGALVTYSQKDSFFSPIWEKIEGEISKIVDNITFEELCDKTKGGVYYI